MKRQEKLIEIRQIEYDPDSMKGDPLEDLGKILMFIAACCGIAIVVLIVEFIMYAIKNI